MSTMEQNDAQMTDTLKPPFKVQVDKKQVPLSPIVSGGWQWVVKKSLVRKYAWKRAADIVISIMAMLMLLPFCLVVAVAIRLTSHGPVIYCQERVGLNRRFTNRRRNGSKIEIGDRRNGDRRNQSHFGKPFVMYKFRTMIEDAERDYPVWAEDNDPRITPVGRILRKFRIDEIPQFVNVLLGDMSIVGPRPERSFFISECKDNLPGLLLRLCVKPGISGLAQVELGYTSTVEQLQDKIKWDLQYIECVTPWTDLKILAKTLLVVLAAKGT